MNEGVIILNGTQVQRIKKNKKFFKILNNPNMKILEECTLEELEDKFQYWKNKLEKPETENNNSIFKYVFKNKHTGGTLISIYNNLDNLKKDININDYEYIGTS